MKKMKKKQTEEEEVIPVAKKKLIPEQFLVYHQKDWYSVHPDFKKRFKKQGYITKKDYLVVHYSPKTDRSAPIKTFKLLREARSYARTRASRKFGKKN